MSVFCEGVRSVSCEGMGSVCCEGVRSVCCEGVGRVLCWCSLFTRLRGLFSGGTSGPWALIRVNDL